VGVLHGPVVFIDDQLNDELTDASKLAAQIRDSGRPLATYTALPPIDHQTHWRSLGFVVLDWDLVPGSPGMIGSSTLSDFQRQELFAWLTLFMSQIFCPVFIVSAEDTADISRQVSENQALERAASTGRIAVFSKSSLLDDFVGYLENWVASRPALTALNIWANELESASNRLFLDMDDLAPDWPAYVWSNAKADGVDPSFELASVLSANLLHRIDPLSFEVPAIAEYTGELTRPAMRRVLQGRTALPGNRLYPTMVQPGDLFSDEDGNVLWLNVTPACHTVLNRPASPGEEPEPAAVILHLVKGTRLERPGSKSAFGKLKEKDGPNGAVVHAVLDDAPVHFDFKDPQISTWGELEARRIGRLLPPYITLIQQRHAAFLMNEGLPRVDWSLYDDAPDPA
jgi:hypothetical protein